MKQSIRPFLVFLVALAVILIGTAASTAPFAKNQQSAKTQTTSALTCFTANIPASPHKSENCDDLCATQGAACVAPNSIAFNPPLTCSSNFSNISFPSCRCCKVTQ